MTKRVAGDSAQAIEYSAADPRVLTGRELRSLRLNLPHLCRLNAARLHSWFVEKCGPLAGRSQEHGTQAGEAAGDRRRP